MSQKEALSNRYAGLFSFLYMEGDPITTLHEEHSNFCAVDLIKILYCLSLGE